MTGHPMASETRLAGAWAIETRGPRARLLLRTVRPTRAGAWEAFEGFRVYATASERRRDRAPYRAVRVTVRPSDA